MCTINIYKDIDVSFSSKKGKSKQFKVDLFFFAFCKFKIYYVPLQRLQNEEN